MSRFAAGLLLAALALPALGSCTTIGVDAAHPEAKAYDRSREASADVDAALAKSQISGKKMMLVMGANWCHDSRAFAGWMKTPRFAAMLEQNFETVYIDVGVPQNGKGRNLAIAGRFGLGDIVGTPTVMIVAPDGTLLNSDTAGSWRNAASRSEDAIFDELAAYAAEKRHSPS